MNRSYLLIRNLDTNSGFTRNRSFNTNTLGCKSKRNIIREIRNTADLDTRCRNNFKPGDRRSAGNLTEFGFDAETAKSSNKLHSFSVLAINHITCRLRLIMRKKICRCLRIFAVRTARRSGRYRCFFISSTACRFYKFSIILDLGYRWYWFRRFIRGIRCRHCILRCNRLYNRRHVR